MKPSTYTLGERCMAYLLLISLFLQSCYNASSYMPARPMKVEKEMGIGQLALQASRKGVENVPSSSELPSLEAELCYPKEEEIQPMTGAHPELSKGAIEVYLVAEQPTAPAASTKAHISQVARVYHAAKPGTRPLPAPKSLQARQQAIQQNSNNSLPTSGFKEAADKKEARPALANPAIPLVASSKRQATHSLTSHSFVTRKGEKIQFQEIELGQWQARVEESHLVGFQNWPVYLAPDMNFTTLAQRK